MPINHGGPCRRAEAMQLVRTKIMPTERSRPEVRTGKVCAMATSASSTPLLATAVTRPIFSPTPFLTT
jgi:hypothetical protein